MRVVGVLLILLGGITLGFQGWVYGMSTRPTWVDTVWEALRLSELPWLLPILGGAMVAAGLMLLARYIGWDCWNRN